MKAVMVEFKRLGKKYYFGVGKLKLNKGDSVIVDTVRGTELGKVFSDVFELDMKDLTSELKDVVRIASLRDKETYEKNLNDALEVTDTVKSLVKERHLDMKVLESEYTLDRGKLIIYFESEERVDFRELVKDIAEVYHTRIELRQVGSRDGAKVFGGIGPCGLIVCCKTFITEFANVSIKMAKNQNLSLNPANISGNCGKLLCCINYENDLYTELHQNAPNVGDIVETEKGNAKVITCDVLNRNLKVKYLTEEQVYGYYKIDDVKFKAKKGTYKGE
jgi:cell fate regulator YaaT (PSP1 superfamily)